MDASRVDSYEYWNNRAVTYSEVNKEELSGVQRKNWITLLEEEITTHFPEKKEDIAILDIGAGPGFLSIILAEHGYNVTAADYSEEMIRQARINATEINAEIDFKKENAMDLSFADNTYDVIVSRNLVWNLADPKTAYREWLRVLKPNGLMMVFDANWYIYLRDEQSREAYDRDRQNVIDSGYDDYNIGENFDKMERIADNLPMTDVIRPNWDVKYLESLSVKQVSAVENIGEKVYSHKEKVNYSSTPMFMVKTIKE